MHRIGEAMHSAPLRLDQQEGREGGELSERSICELRALAASGRDLAELLPLLDGLVSLIRHGPDERSDQKENRSEKFPSNQEESRWGGVVRLMQLESEVLAKLWPAERVVCGQMVCRSLRANLRLSKHVVLKARKKCSVLDLAAANFAQYKGRDVSLSLDSKSQHKVLFAAMDRDTTAAGWRGPTALNCRYNNMSAKCSGRLAAMLHTFSVLQELDLSENALLGPEISPIALALPACPQLHTLILQGLGFKPEGSRRIASAIVQLPALTSLDLRGNRLGQPTGNEGWCRLVAALPRCHRLRRLHLGDNLLMAQGGVALANVLGSCTELESLNLCKNSLRGPGAAALADVLPLCSKLSALDLCGNELGDIGARNLAAELPSCGSLSSLALRGNRIGPETVKRIEDSAPPACHLLF
jgi:hypothetical protein